MVKETIELDRRELVNLLFKLDSFGDKLVEEGNDYKRLVKKLREEHFFKTRKENKQ